MSFKKSVEKYVMSFYRKHGAKSFNVKLIRVSGYYLLNKYQNILIKHIIQQSEAHSYIKKITFKYYS